MIVEDEIDSRNVLALLFNLHGFEVMTATNGQAALDLIASHRPDIVVTDVTMPIMDGLAMCGRLRAQNSTRGIPIFVLTAAEGVSASDAGLYDELMRKPVDFPELLSRVRDRTAMK